MTDSGGVAAAGMQAVLTVDGLSCHAGGQPILHDASFALGEGELAVVMGSSGSGKTTLLRCLNRLLEPETGRVLLDGVDTSAMAPVELRRRVRMVSQVPFMFPGSVRDNLRRAADYGGTGVDDQRCSELLERVGLEGMLDRDAAALSIGQQQRVAVARALVGRPRLLLCDEPTASLDEQASRRLEATLRELSGGGMTIVFVTHDAAQAERIADRLLVLRDGVLRDGARPSPPARPSEDA